MLQSSVLYTGTQQLLSDASTALMVIAPLIALCLLVFFSIARSASDDVDEVKYKKRQKLVLICLIMAELAGVIIKLFLSYYGTNVSVF